MNRRSYSGSNNPNYRGVITYCIDCNSIIKYQRKRCKKCDLIFKKRYPNNRPPKGTIPWNKGRTKETDSRVLKYGKTRSKNLIKNGTFKGENHPLYGKKHKESTLKKLSLTRGGTGIPYENTEYGTRFNDELKEQVRFRDGYKCKVCYCSQLDGRRQLAIHHIDYDKKNNDITNLISLCGSCHAKTNQNRKYWIQFFTNKQKLKENKCLKLQ